MKSSWVMQHCFCSLNNEVKEYRCKIIKLNAQNHQQKSMEIEITDERLLSQTGGIV